MKALLTGGGGCAHLAPGEEKTCGIRATLGELALIGCREGPQICATGEATRIDDLGTPGEARGELEVATLPEAGGSPESGVKCAGIGGEPHTSSRVRGLQTGLCARIGVQIPVSVLGGETDRQPAGERRLEHEPVEARRSSAGEPGVDAATAMGGWKLPLPVVTTILAEQSGLLKGDENDRSGVQSTAGGGTELELHRTDGTPGHISLGEPGREPWPEDADAEPLGVCRTFGSELVAAAAVSATVSQDSELELGSERVWSRARCSCSACQARRSGLLVVALPGV